MSSSQIPNTDAEVPSGQPDNNGKLLPSLTKAWEKAREAKNQNFLMKVGIFFKTFFEEMKGVEKEKETVSRETQEAVEKNIDETMKDARVAVKLRGDIGEDDSNFYDEVLAMTVAGKEELDEAKQISVQTALPILNRAVSSEVDESLNFDQSRSITTVGLMTIEKLKAKYPDRSKFQEAIEKFSKISESSKYPLGKLLNMSVLKIFKPTDSSEAAKLMSAFGINVGTNDLVGSLLENIPHASDVAESMGLNFKGEALEAKKILSGLKEKPMKNEDQIVNFMKKYFFPNTDEGGIRKVTKIINNMIYDKAEKLTFENLTELVFNISDADLKRLIKILTK